MADRIKLVLDTNIPFGVIAGRKMTRVLAGPIEDVMRKLESVTSKDWIPIGTEQEPGEQPSLAFSVAIEDIEWWVEYFGKE